MIISQFSKGTVSVISICMLISFCSFFSSKNQQSTTGCTVLLSQDINGTSQDIYNEKSKDCSTVYINPETITNKTVVPVTHPNLLPPPPLLIKMLKIFFKKYNIRIAPDDKAMYNLFVVQKQNGKENIYTRKLYQKEKNVYVSPAGKSILITKKEAENYVNGNYGKDFESKIARFVFDDLKITINKNVKQ